jgi:hypothetical protein
VFDRPIASGSATAAVCGGLARRTGRRSQLTVTVNEHPALTMAAERSAILTLTLDADREHHSHMRNATRNRVVVSVMMALLTAMAGAFVWIALGASEGLDGGGGAVLLVVLWAGVLVGMVRDARKLRRVERLLEAEGVALPDEAPIPIKLARDRQPLVAGLIALLLIGLTFLAYHMGWLAAAGIEGARPA